jgi:hypothetical protein
MRKGESCADARGERGQDGEDRAAARVGRAATGILDFPCLHQD